MSIEALRWSLEKGMEHNLEPTLRYVLLILGNRADEQGYLYPSVQWICQRTGLSRRTVQRHLQTLQDKELLRRDTREKEDGGRTSDALQLTMEQPGLFQHTPRVTMTPPRATVTRPPRHGGEGGGATMTPYTQEDTQDQKKQSTASAFALPDWIREEVWKAYEDMRKKIRKPMTDRARDLIIKKLHDMKQAGQEANAVLEQSVIGSWTNVYPIKPDAQAKTNGPGWWESDQTMLKKAQELNIGTKGLTTQQLKVKISEKLSGQQAH